jgi:hypothetical protein
LGIPEIGAKLGMASAKGVILKFGKSVSSGFGSSAWGNDHKYRISISLRAIGQTG